MYLKSIEMQGFKSFAHKILFEFNDGITGIVGPNGSGKSNVADAVRWVLGEQSAKQLRGSKMEDIIFSGTETRRPLGFAYVAITLDNSCKTLPVDYEEVVVARRVYRSGESEYLVNGSSCRLRDVQEMFFDTGIGKEGYSIIGQGQIDKILSGKPEERRELFDEAAGIVKFKRRKQASEKNLEKERQNLHRVTDIVNEIKNQLSPLEKQSEKAKVYLKLKEQQKDLEVRIFVMEYNKQKETVINITDNLKLSENEFLSVEKEYENTKEEYTKLESKIEEWDLSIEEKRSEFNRLNLEKEKLEGEIKLLKEQISGIIKNDEYQQGRIDLNEEENKIKIEELAKYKREKDEFNKELSSIKEELGRLNLDLEKSRKVIRSYNDKINESNQESVKHQNSNSDIKIKLSHFETMLEQSKLSSKGLAQNQVEIAERKDDLIKVKDKLYTEHKEILNLKDKKVHNINDLRNELNNLVQMIDHESGIIENKRQDYLRRKSSLDSLINMTERYEGYGNSIKKVMERKQTNPGIIGVIADIIKVKETYETAIETTLGGAIQNIVTKDETIAKEMIAYLKQNRLGRATFLPLTNISQGNTLHNHRVLDEQGVLGIGSDLVNCKDEYKDLISYLLGRIIVVDNIENATIIARKYNFSLRIVTLEGELLTPGGSISGGAYRNKNNLLGRKRQFEELEAQVRTLATEIKSSLAELEEEKLKKQNMIESLNVHSEELQELNLKENTVKMNLDSTLNREEEIQQEYNSVLLNQEKTEDDIEKFQDNLKFLNEKLNDNSDLMGKQEEEIASFTDIINREQGIEEELANKESSLSMNYSSLVQKIEFSLSNIRRIEGEIEKLILEKDQLHSEVNKASSLISEKQNEISIAKENHLRYDDEIEDLDDKIQKEIKEKDGLVVSHRGFFAKREELSERRGLLDKEIYRLNVQLEKMGELLKTKADYMWDEYELTYNLAVEYNRDSDMSLNKSKDNIKEVKNKIKELGVVNVTAIEDYKELSDRYEFLKEQREDIVKAEEALLEIIDILDEEMRKQFTERFTEIQREFNTVFKELFGGGSGSIELDDSNDILDSGILINAQPPGKKLQNIMQLSGGEKALTAISLLFAIQNLKPSPFCLLDEIEAALDESNVIRFAKYLDNLKARTQFIIITHRRGTMSAADTLYGITMHEKGVSTLVSVNLIENELEDSNIASNMEG